MNQNQLQHLIKKCYEIDRLLGGQAEKVGKAKKSGEFDSIKDLLIEKIFEVKKLQDQRDEKMNKYGNDRDQIAMGVKIRDGIHEAERLLVDMHNQLQRMAKKTKKYTNAEIELRTKLHSKYTENVDNLKARESGEEIDTYGDNKPLTMMQHQQNVFGKQKDRVVVYEMTKDEEQALQRFQDNDKMIDDKIDIIIDGIGQLKPKVQRIGGQIDDTGKQINGLHKEVDKANEQLLTSNKKLKELLVKFRQPNKFCLDITLFLLLLGIIYVAVTMVQKQ